MTVAELKRLVNENTTVPIWPEAGQALGYKSRSATYDAVKNGIVQTVDLGNCKKRVSTFWLAQKVGIHG